MDGNKIEIVFNNHIQLESNRNLKFLRNLQKQTGLNKMSHMALDQLPDPGNRYQLQDVIGCGVSGKVIRLWDHL